MDYNDIISLPHHVSQKHPQMSMLKRASQFAPFAALTGHGMAIQETARKTDEWVECDEVELDALNRNILDLMAHLAEHPRVRITYFIPDTLKDGGKYKTIEGAVLKLDMTERVICLDNEIKVFLQLIKSIEIC